MLNSKLNFVAVPAILLASAVALFAQNPTPLLTKNVDELIAVIKSDAQQKEKADACRQLAVIGTKAAVPALAALLPDERLSHMARFALEPIPDPSVDAALRDALGKLQGRLLAGVIGSLGVRRDTQAIAPLSRLLQDADPDVAQAAARALGKIGAPAAAKALEGALATVPTANQLAFCEGLFRCAEALAADGQRDQATGIYDRLRTVQGAPHQVRAGALRGAVLMRQKKGLPLLMEAIRGDDFVLVDAAARTAMEMPGAEVTKALAAELGKLPADKQVLVIQTLGKRGDAGALPALLAAVKSDTKAVRVAAIRALPEIGDAKAMPVLVDFLQDSDRETAQAAQDGLAGFPGKKADAVIISMLSSRDAAQRLAAIDLVGRRRMTSCLPALLKAATDMDLKIRSAALRKAGELGGPAEVPVLSDLLMEAKPGQDLDAAEQALSTLCAKAENPDACAANLAKRMTQAGPAQKGALLRVLSSIGGSTALKAVRTAVNDPSKEVRDAAIRALGAWKTADAAPDLLALAKNASSPTDKMLCLRSYLDLATQPELPAAQRLSMCQEAAGLIQKSDEKKLLLSALGSINSADALPLITPYLDDAATRDEAGAATLAIAEKLLKGRNNARITPKLIAPLEKVAQVSGNEDLVRRAKTLLQQAQKGSSK